MGSTELKTEPAVSIIMLNWNGKNDTIECLNSLSCIDYPNYQIILVDNGSTDGLAEIVQGQFPDTVLLKNKENLGFAEGNNVGIRYVLSQQSPDYILLLNNDTVVAPSFLSELVKVGENYPEFGMLSPLIYWYTSPEKIWFYSGEMPQKEGYCDHKRLPEGETIENIIRGSDHVPKEYLDDTDYLSGCALLVKSEVIRQIGLLDARFFSSYEDADWSIRCKKAGWKLAVVPSAKIWHKVTSSPIKHYILFLTHRNLILFLWKHSNPFQFLLRVKRYIYRELAKYSWHREQYYRTLALTPLDGIWAGLSGHYGNTCQKMPGWLWEFIYRYIRYLLWIFRYPR
jgi:GT2 family glycosyltransferase